MAARPRAPAIAEKKLPKRAKGVGGPEVGAMEVLRTPLVNGGRAEMRPSVSMVQVIPVLALRTMGRRSSRQRQRALMAWMWAAGLWWNQLSLVTLTMSCGSGRTKRRTWEPTESSKQTSGMMAGTVRLAGKGVVTVPGEKSRGMRLPSMFSRNGSWRRKGMNSPKGTSWTLAWRRNCEESPWRRATQLRGFQSSGAAPSMESASQPVMSVVPKARRESNAFMLTASWNQPGSADSGQTRSAGNEALRATELEVTRSS